MTAVIFACLVIVIVAGSMIGRWVRKDEAAPDLEVLSNRVSVIASMLASAAPSERDIILDVANRGDWTFSLRPAAFSQRFTTTSPTEPLGHRLVDWFLPPDNGTVPLGGWRTFVDGERVLAATVDDKQLVVLEQVPERFLRGDVLSFGSNFLVALVSLMTLFSIFAVRAITQPLRRIAAAAARTDISLASAPFEERGSVEIVALARALNGMQRRISMMADARTRMLRGISHDLRTPLTRLRLRADRIAEADMRAAFLADIERIDRLLTESLSYLRDQSQSENSERADLASVLKTVCHEFADSGHDVRYRGPARLVANFRPLALTRALTNLCENAVKFGTRVDVTLDPVDDMAVVTVADNGPGIPAGQRKQVLEPFYKVDVSRGTADVGFGLGLSIVLEVIQAHGGDLELLDNEPRGLIARFTVPLEQNRGC
ncbi:ATP-binding protein [Shinella sp. CPCC 101442]|uniref:ATP-binding protein n=1 Tax=Shinella sp. CPCC 101442 TaxID=2932265 RepID=UPI0021521808|nr:ATP-binding protein [Shinella sp. CPCC 101442]MCR6503057.1 ATP-binding protein [Shinella sp. CPCC 101442]